MAKPRSLDGERPGLLFLTCLRGLLCLCLSSASCSTSTATPQADSGSADATTPADSSSLAVDAVSADALPPPGSFCSLPGSVVSTPQGPLVVPGGDAAAPDLSWLRLPIGFCAHYFATVRTSRQLAFAPGGDLFVASPSRGTTGGAGDGIAGIVVLPDDDHDGRADANITFLNGLDGIQGLMFAKGYLYYQDGAMVRRVAFRQGDRRAPTKSEVVTDMASWPQDGLHWPKVFDMARDGTIYLSNGGSQSDRCESSGVVRGAIVKLEEAGATSVVAKGFRNPIAMRCASKFDVCLVAELALDYSAGAAGREKLVPLRPGDDWGYPCCATRNTPYTGVTYSDNGKSPDCSGVAAEGVAFIIGHTPFGLDFETGRWPPPWTGRVFVTLHGDFQGWVGARVVAIALDPTTGIPLAATEFADSGIDPANMLDFARGWDDGTQTHGRPAPATFAADGRLFLGDDQRGAVIWIAPIGLMR